MQKPINYTDLFQFYLHYPIAIFEDLTEEQIAEDCYEMGAIPVVYIKNKKHPLFKRLQEEFLTKQIKQPLIMIVLAVSYNQNYTS
jgi:hypothetical protein